MHWYLKDSNLGIIIFQHLIIFKGATLRRYFWSLPFCSAFIFLLLNVVVKLLAQFVHGDIVKIQFCFRFQVGVCGGWILTKSLETCVSGHHKSRWQFFNEGKLFEDDTFEVLEKCQFNQDFPPYLQNVISYFWGIRLYDRKLKAFVLT